MTAMDDRARPRRWPIAIAAAAGAAVALNLLGAAGRPRPADETPLPGETGRSLQLPSRYTPVETGGATDDYHCFLLDPQLDADVYVTSARIDPGARSEVHHVILFKVPPSQV